MSTHSHRSPTDGEADYSTINLSSHGDITVSHPHANIMASQAAH